MPRSTTYWASFTNHQPPLTGHDRMPDTQLPAPDNTVTIRCPDWQTADVLRDALSSASWYVDDAFSLNEMPVDDEDEPMLLIEHDANGDLVALFSEDPETYWNEHADSL